MEGTDSLDTETLLAILSSLLDPPLPEQEVLLDALTRANGTVEVAAKALQLKQSDRAVPSASRTTKKRVATGVLDDWLTPSSAESSKKPKRTATFTPPTMVTKLTKRAQAASPNAILGPSKDSESSKRLIPLTDVLRPPPPTSPTVPQLAPLTLSNPTMVEKHTPCTLHLGVLPPELACRLFHLMVNASKGEYLLLYSDTLANFSFMQNGRQTSGGCLTGSWKVHIRPLSMPDR
jgi:hypothetical protein